MRISLYELMEYFLTIRMSAVLTSVYRQSIVKHVAGVLNAGEQEAESVKSTTRIT